MKPSGIWSITGLEDEGLLHSAGTEVTARSLLDTESPAHRPPSLTAYFGHYLPYTWRPSSAYSIFSPSPFLHFELCACIADSEMCLHSAERKGAVLGNLLLLSWSLRLWIWLLPAHNMRVSDVFKNCCKTNETQWDSQECLLERSSTPADVHQTLFSGWISYFYIFWNKLFFFFLWKSGSSV